MRNPRYRAFVDAGVEAGYGATADYNGARQEGFGAMHMTVKDGVRWSTANAYLKPALKRPNLHLVTHALAHRLTGAGRRITGVEYAVGGEMHRAVARREVIVAAGPIGSTPILQRSGIGPAGLLNRPGIAVVADRTGVGGNRIRTE